MHSICLLKQHKSRTGPLMQIFDQYNKLEAEMINYCFEFLI